jgi:hypothetical protein
MPSLKAIIGVLSYGVRQVKQIIPPKKVEFLSENSKIELYQTKKS